MGGRGGGQSQPNLWSGQDHPRPCDLVAATTRLGGPDHLYVVVEGGADQEIGEGGGFFV